jgi:Integrase/Phage integrase, N-terminal
VKDLVFEVRRRSKKKPSGSHATQSDRTVMLSNLAKVLDAQFPKLKLENVGQKHVDYLVHFIRDGSSQKTRKKFSIGTQKNMLAALRWLLKALNRTSLLPPNNDDLGIARRTYVTNRDKSVILTPEQIAKVVKLDQLVGASLRLQIEFGFRIEESIKCIPSLAFRGDSVFLRGSWTKGNVPRIVRLTNDRQRQAILDAIEISGGRALIPDGQSYVAHRRHVRSIYASIGLKRTHGLRHAYAIRRFEELAGFICPVRGGPAKKDQPPEMRERDRIAREAVSEELGHHRTEITKTYVGSATFKTAESEVSEVDRILGE